VIDSSNDDIVQWAIARADKNERVYRIQPRCPECDTKQVQIMDVDEQEWRCRKCGHTFYTEVDV
jgi:ribosomal protein L37AE/L43A